MHFHGKKSPQLSLPRSRGAGVQKFLDFLDSRFNGNDGKGRFPNFFRDRELSFREI